MALENMRSLLRGSLGRSLQTLSEADRLAAAWPVACGRAMAPHGEIVGLSAGVLTIQVIDPAWLSQMVSMHSQLQRDLAAIAQVKLTAIHFQTRSR